VGSGDPLGMQGTHTQAAGIGGMRAAGDLVARMQMTRGMRLNEAKDYVAAKLGVSAFDLSDPAVMADVRNEYGLGRIHSYAISHPGRPNFIEAKFNISRVLDVPINCVERFKERAGLAPTGTSV
jgi:dimethylamine--corrinoid protein Co-methyltransferase